LPNDLNAKKHDGFSGNKSELINTPIKNGKSGKDGKATEIPHRNPKNNKNKIPNWIQSMILDIVLTSKG